MTIALDSEIVATRFDTATRTCFYTIARNGKQWTVGIHLDQLEKHGPLPKSRQQRRVTLANALMVAMQGPADGE